MAWLERRDLIIKKIILTLEKIELDGSRPDREKFIALICSDTGCARRTAIEYLTVAETRFDQIAKQKLLEGS